MWSEINRKKSTKYLLMMLDLSEAMAQLVKASSVLWYLHALRKEENNFLRRVLDLNARGTWKMGTPNKTSLKAVIDQSRNVGLNESDADDRSKWRLGVNTISSTMR